MRLPAGMVLLCVLVSLSTSCLNRGGRYDDLQSELSVDPPLLPADGLTRALVSLHVALPSGSIPDNASVQILARPSDLSIAPVTPGAAPGDFSAWVTGAIPGPHTLFAELVSPLQVFSIPSFANLEVVDPGRMPPGVPSSVTSSLVALPTSVAPDGQSVTQLILTARDNLQEPVPGARITFTSTGTQNFFSASTALTDLQGVATVTLASTTAETKRVTSQMGTGAAVASVIFSLDAVSVARSDLTADPDPLTANGTAQAQLTLVARNTEGMPLSGRNVSWQSSGTGNSFTQEHSSTDPNGVATALLASTHAETKQVRAVVDGEPIWANVTFLAGAPDLTHAQTGTTQSGTATADGMSGIVVTTTVVDAYGNPIAGQPVTVTGGPQTSFFPASGVTDGNGVFSTTVTSTDAGSQTITFTIGNAGSTTTTVSFAPGPIAVANSSFDVVPSTLAADGLQQATLTVSVIDAFYNPVVGTWVTLSSDGTGDTLSQSGGATDHDGKFTATLQSTHAERKTLRALVQSQTLTAVATFVAGPANNLTSSIVASPSVVPADGVTASQLFVSVRDAQGNPISGKSVALSSTGSNVAIMSPSGASDGNGVFASSMTSNTLQVVTVSALIDGNFSESATVTFAAGAPSLATCSLTAQPNTVVANNSNTSAVTLLVHDAQNNPVQNISVSLSASGTANTVTAASGVTDASGLFTATLKSSKAEPKTLTATVGGLSLEANVMFVAGPTASATSTLTVNPALGVVADNSDTTTLTFVAQDANGNVVSGQPVTFSSSGIANVIANTSGFTDQTGTFSTTLKTAKAETKTVTATAGAASKTQNVTFVPGPVSASTSTLGASPSIVIADGSSSTSLQVLALDAQSNTVANQNVLFSSSGSANSFAPPSGTTDINGGFSATLASTKAEAKTVTATLGTVSLTANVNFVAGAPSASTSSIVMSPNAVLADGAATSVATVTAKDAQSNVVGGQAVVLSSTGSNNAFTPQNGNTNASGTFSATLSSSTAEAKTVTATMGAVNKAATVMFLAGSPNTTTTTLVASPTSLVANATAASTLTLTVRDAKGNPVGNQNVSISSTGTGNALSASTGVTTAGGVFTATLTSSHAETKTITATAGSVTKTATVQFVAGTPSNSTSTLSASPLSVPADNATTTSLTFTLQDLQGNPVNAQSVTFVSSGSNNTFSATTGTTNASGVFVATLSSAKAEVKTVTASSGAVSKTASVTFNVGAPSNANSNVVALPTMLAADGVANSNVTVTLQDAQGNPVGSQAVTFAVSGTGGAIVPTTSSTNVLGVANASVTSTKAEIKSVTVTAGGASISAAITFQAGSPSTATTTLAANPNSVAADGSSASTLIFTVRDAQGNFVPNSAVTFSATATHATLSNSTTTTDPNGLATTSLTATDVQSATVTAVTGGVSKTATVTFIAPVISATNSSLTASASPVTADGNSAITLSVTVRNGSNAPVAGQTVTFASTGANNVFTPPSATTDSSGMVTATLKSTTAETKTVTAMVLGTNLTVGVTFKAGAASSTATTFVANPNSVIADGTAASTLSVVVKDAQGNPVNAQAVSLSASGYSASGSTDPNGLYNATMTSTSAVAKTVTATIGGFTKTATVTFIPGSPSSSMSTVTANPNLLTADGTTRSVVSFTVKDAQGNIIPNQTVGFASSGSNNLFTPPSGPTNASGVFNANMTSTKAEAKVVLATAGAMTQNVGVTFTAGAAASATSSLVASPNTVVANNANTATLTLTVQDAQNNPLANQPLTFASSGSGYTFGSMTGNTALDGTFTTTFKSTTAQVATVTASFGGVNKTVNVNFVAGPPNTSTTSFVASPTSVTADGSTAATLTLTLQDANNNAVGNQNVTFSSSGTSNTLTPLNGATNASGILTATLASTMAEVKTVTATAGSVSKTAGVTFTAGAPDTIQTTFVANPNSGITANNNATTALLATLKDVHGNAVGNYTVSLASTGVGNSFSPVSGATSVAGVFTSSFKSGKAEIKVITATMGTLTKNANATFVAGPPSQLTSSVSVNPGSLAADNANTTTVTVTVLDANSNPVNLQAVSVASSGTGNAFASMTGNTDMSGTWSTTLKSTVAETKTITATVGGFTANTNVIFVAGSPNTTNTTFVVNPNSVADNGIATATCTVTVRDAYNNLCNNTNVALSGGVGNTFTPQSGATTSGVFSATVKSTVAQTETITATIGAVTKTATMTFVVGAPSNTMTTIVASPNSLVANNANTSAVTVTVRDSTGNPIANQNVTVVSSGTGNTLSMGSLLTNAAGQVTGTLKSSTAESKTLTATVAAFNVATTVSFVVGPPSSTQSSITASPASLAADNSTQTTLTVTAKDSQGNLIGSQPVTLSSSGTGNTFSSTSGNTNSSTGVFAATLKSSMAETKTVQAILGAATVSTSVAFTSTASCSATLMYGNQVPSPNVGTLPNDIAAGDFNGDGKTDLVTANSANLSVLLGVGNGTFAQPVTIANGDYPYSVVVADFNADGKADFATANQSTYRVGIYMGSGSGTFATAVTYAVGADPYGLVAGDFNGDGKIDLATTLNNTSKVGVLLNSGTGTFGAIATYAIGTNPVGVATGDFNGDGKLDLVCANETAKSVSVLLGSGTGTFSAAVTFAAGNDPQPVAVGDVNGDGKLDVVAGNYGDDAVGVFIGSGTGTFAAQVVYTVDNSPTDLILRDMNGDGKLDVIAADYASNDVSVLLGSGTGTFAATANRQVGVSPVAVLAVDLNGDTKLDVVTANSISSDVSVLLGNGTGSFSAVPYAGVGTYPLSIATADFNGDGKADVATANYTSGTISVLLGTGTGGFSGVTAFNAGTYVQSARAHDIDGDGHVDLAIANVTTGKVGIMLGTGTGSFGAPTSYTAASAFDTVFGDLNGDGRVDLIVGSEGTTSISVLLGSGAGAFGAASTYSVGGSSYGALTVSDLNGDGKLDVAVCVQNQNAVVTLLGNGTGTLAAATSHAVGASPASVVAADFNGDAVMDLVTANLQDNTISVLTGSGSGAFAAAVSYPTGYDPADLWVADMNGDGKNDLVVANAQGNTVGIMLGSGHATFGPIADYGAGASVDNMVVADFNGDGRLDVGTVNATLNAVGVLLYTGCLN